MDETRWAFVFPGQGSQKIGMGRDWAEGSAAAREVFEEADDVLGFGLTRLCWEGPEDELALTANLQPALLTTSVAILRAAAEELPTPVAVAGHSLGEYSALVAAGVLTFADALRLVRRRGELMQAAVPVGQGAMAAILGMDDAAVDALVAAAAEGDVLAVANRNAPGQLVLAGATAAVERALERARAEGGKPKLLPVSAPFHCPLMAPAREGLAPMLAATAFADPRVPVVVNVNAMPVTSGAAARNALERQIDGTVRWIESVVVLTDDLGATGILEVGPGAVLQGLVKRIRPDVRRCGLAEPSGLGALRPQPTT
ncbi:MAG: ACP S-malonyltransferase [Thermoanaerobaculia bacterium]|nr:ACP S-malonyltransferase [Thermoanaerobaculia bacterium]